MIKIISAGAGSGKTYSLTQEMLNLLRPDGEGKAAVRASGIVATTFTARAAAELEERVRVKLLQEGLSAEADQLANAMIGTVHSIGVKLLKRFAFEAGVSPIADIMADSEQQVFFNRSLASVLTPEKIEEMQVLSERLGFEKNEKDWRSEIKQLSDIARSNNFSAEVLNKSLQRSLDTFFEMLPKPAKMSNDGYHARLLGLLGDAVKNVEGNDDGTKTKETCLNETMKPLFNRLKNGEKLHWGEWAKISKLKISKKSLPDVEELMAFAATHDENELFQKDIKDFVCNIFTIAQDSLNAFQAYKKQRGIIDYTDMEVELLRLLELPSVQETLRDELDLLLVDEFQDTSPIQLEIFLKLSRIAKQAIWVGDIKQSIYGFRGAEPALMQAVMQQPNYTLAYLEKSWRSRQDLVYSVNAIFVKAFPKLEPRQIALGIPEHNSRDKEHIELSTTIRQWNFNVEDEGKTPGADWFMACIAKKIKAVLSDGLMIRQRDGSGVRPLVAGDIAVLCRGNLDCQKMAEALSQNGIGASIARDGLLETPEIKLTLACLQFIINEHDTLSIAEILLLADRQKIENILEHRFDFLEKREAGEIHRRTVWAYENTVIQELSQLRKQVTELSASEILSLVIEILDIRRIIAAWGDTAQKLDNLETLRALAKEYEEACNRLHNAASLGGLLLWLDDLRSEGKDKQGLGAGEDAVNVLTYHKSKGLEWGMVICYNLENNLRDNLFGFALLNENEDFNLESPLSGRLVRYWINPYGKQSQGTALHESLLQNPASAEAKLKELEEEARLLYVGLTRARDYLVLPTRSGKKTAWLNRVYHNGDEDKPSLDVDSSECLWMWNEEIIPIESDNIREPREYLPAAKPNHTHPVHWLPKRIGAREHQPLFITHSKDKDLQAETQRLRIGTIYQYHQHPLSKDEKTELGEIVQSVFSAAAPLLNTSESAALLQKFSLPQETHKLILNILTDFNTFLKKQFSFSDFRKNYDFKKSWNNRYVETTFETILEKPDGSLIVIVTLPAEASDQSKLKNKSLEEGRLYAFSARLLSADFGKVAEVFIHFPLSGILIELTF